MEKAVNMETVPDVLFSPTKIPVPSDQMNRSFNNYEAYKKDMSPAASKADYRAFLTTVQKEKVSYDSNIAHAMQHHHKVIAYKNKE